MYMYVYIQARKDKTRWSLVVLLRHPLQVGAGYLVLLSLLEALAYYPMNPYSICNYIF
jgi:hypothetical protein